MLASPDLKDRWFSEAAAARCEEAPVPRLYTPASWRILRADWSLAVPAIFTPKSRAEPGSLPSFRRTKYTHHLHIPLHPLPAEPPDGKGPHPHPASHLNTTSFTPTTLDSSAPSPPPPPPPLDQLVQPLAKTERSVSDC